MHDQFQDLKMHAAEMGQTPTKWVVGPGVIEAVQKYMAALTTVKDTGDLDFFGVPMERSVDLPDGRVALMCGQWSAGAFNIHLKEDSDDG